MKNKEKNNLDRKKMFTRLDQELKVKNVSLDELRKAEKKIFKYIRNLENEMAFDLKTSLKEFIYARR